MIQKPVNMLKRKWKKGVIGYERTTSNEREFQKRKFLERLIINVVFLDVLVMQ